MLEISLHARVAVVTGAATGIGRATAFMLAKAGAKVAVNHLARDREAGSAVAQIGAEGGTAIAIEADVSDSAQVKTMAQRAQEAPARSTFW